MTEKVLTVYPELVRIDVGEETNLLEILKNEGYFLESPCGKLGLCGKCIIKIEGKINSPNRREEEIVGRENLLKGYRLACQVQLEGDVFVEFPHRQEQLEIKAEAVKITDKPTPEIKKIFLDVRQPDLQFNLADLERVKNALGNELKNVWIGLEEMRELPEKIRNSNHKVTAILDEGQLIRIEKGDTTSKLYGLAIDLGTTTLSFSLIDMNKGQELACSKTYNPNITHGFDVISRIAYTQRHKRGLHHLRAELLNVINGQIKKLCQKINIGIEELYLVGVTGNPTNIHILMGFRVATIAKAPYIQLFQERIKIKSSQIGMDINPRGIIFSPPSVSAYIGSDILAGIVHAGLEELTGPALFLDIGTNGEMVLRSSRKYYACSTAAGPAFEGMNINCGIRAVPGAITEFTFNKAILTKTVGDKKPIGISGSGLINLMAILLNKELVSKTGKLDFEKFSKVAKIIEDQGEKRIILIDAKKAGNSQPIFINQEDIRQIQLAKGAIRAGLNILLEEAKLKIEDLKDIFIGGDFGQNLILSDLIDLGIFPDGIQAELHIMGNSSLKGLRLIMLDSDKSSLIDEISNRVKTIQLSADTRFKDEFLKQLDFP